MRRDDFDDFIRDHCGPRERMMLLAQEHGKRFVDLERIDHQHLIMPPGVPFDRVQKEAKVLLKAVNGQFFLVSDRLMSTDELASWSELIGAPVDYCLAVPTEIDEALARLLTR